jgi:hypothetical protein
MLKNMTLVAVSTIFAVCVLTAQPNKTTSSKQPTTNQSQSPVILPAPEKQSGSADDKTKADHDSPPWYAPFKQPDGMLVIVGIITCLVIGWQAIETRKAAQGAKDSAEAALLNAQALINSERPRVIVQIEETPGENAAKTRFRLCGYNHGSSPASVISCKGPIVTWLDDPDSELPPSPDYGTWEWDTFLLLPRHKLPLRDEINPWSDGIPRPPKPQLVIYGLLEYRDGVTDTIHRTAFCYRRKRDKLSDMGGHLVPCGPRTYNEYT